MVDRNLVRRTRDLAMLLDDSWEGSKLERRQYVEEWNHSR